MVGTGYHLFDTHSVSDFMVLKSSFCPWLYVLGALVEERIPVPKKMEKTTFLRYPAMPEVW